MAKAASKRQSTPSPVVQDEGVSLENHNGQSYLSFPFSDHLRRVAKEKLPDIEFDPQAKAWRIPHASIAQAEVAVVALREEQARMNADWNKVAETARAGIDNPQVKNAYKAQDARSTGKILAVGEFYMAQANGKNYVAVHEVGILRQAQPGDTPEVVRWERYAPQVGESKSIIYRRGVGVVQERVPEKSKTAERNQQPEARR